MSFVTAESFADQLNRLADAAAVSNPLINPPLIGGTAWAASTAYVTGNIVGNGAYSYICKTSGTSAGSGGPTGTGVSITDGSVVWDFYALQTAPVINAFTTSTGLSSPVTTSYFGSPTSFHLLGGVPISFFGSVVGGTVSNGININGNVQNGTTTTTGISNFGTSIKFSTDSPKFELIFNSGSTWRLIVNGQYVTLNQTSVGSSGGLYYNIIDWTNSGGRVAREYTVEFGNTAGAVSSFYGVNTLATDTPPFSVTNNDAVRAIFLGDSITATQLGTINRASYGDVACKLLGWDDCWMSGIGGEGYITVGNGGSPNIPQRISPPYNDVVQQNPDVVVVAVGVNDGSNSVALIQAAVQRTFIILRFGLPNTLFIVLGPWFLSPSAVPQLLTAEAAIQAGLKAADPLYGTRSFFIPNITQSWMFGSGTAGSPTGDGNADFYMSSEPHPNDAGHAYYGRRLANQIKTLVLPNMYSVV